jgi:hypothetical protein
MPPPLYPPPPNPLGAPAPKTIAAISLLQIFIVSLLEKINWATQALLVLTCYLPAVTIALVITLIKKITNP